MNVRVIAYEVNGWGVGELWLDGDVLVAHELPSARAPGRASDAPPLRDRLVAYFRGERDDFSDVELDLDGSSAFQRAVVAALRAVPYGETVTYGELAALAGHPNAHRAAGTVCARNRFPIVVPCHRVVAADSLGPYGQLGREYKRRLLELEAR
ncbi:MAG: methylated-DNA--[protein]-cysteine S-methyltransferase [Thermoleophilia bacterium]|nr:methylated-DNA--[protein]-cysteine S-methyltransferase [Thermoleophilia bacterium]